MNAKKAFQAIKSEAKTDIAYKRIKEIYGEIRMKIANYYEIE